MARPVVTLALFAFLFVVACADKTTASSPESSTSPYLTPYAAAPSSFDDAAEGSSGDAIDDADAAPIGAPSSDYPPVDDESRGKSGASFVRVSSVATVSVATAAGYFLL